MKYPIGTLFALICLSNALPHPPCPGSASIPTPSLSNATGTGYLVPDSGNATSTPAYADGTGSDGGSSNKISGQTSVQLRRRTVEARKFDMDKVTDDLDDNPGSAVGKNVGHAITNLFDGDKKDEAGDADGEPGGKQTSDGVHTNVASDGGAPQAQRTININLNGGTGGAGTIININLGGEAGEQPNGQAKGKGNGETDGKPTDESHSEAGGKLGGDIGAGIASTVGTIFGGPLGGAAGKLVGGAAGSLLGTLGGGIADAVHGDDHKSDDHDGHRVEGQDGDADSDSGPSCGTITQSSSAAPIQDTPHSTATTQDTPHSTALTQDTPYSAAPTQNTPYPAAPTSTGASGGIPTA